MKCYPMIVVSDVEEGSRWYRELAGLTSGHGGDEFEMLMPGQGLALILHHADPVEHPTIAGPREGRAGRGVLLYFSIDDVGPF